MVKRTNGAMWVLVAILAGTALVAASAAPRKLYPVDEAPRDPSFLAFRNQLIAAVRKRDLRFIHRILALDVTSSFGDEETIAAFKRRFEGKHPEADLWQELLTALSLGGQFQGRHRFCAPYVLTRWPEVVDMADYQAIIGKNVRVRIRPSEAASVVETLSYDLVKVDLEGSVPPHSDHPTWVKITTPMGHPGYVASPDIRSCVDYRACFEKRRGRWRLTALVAGD